MEGKLIWKNNRYTLRYFEKGEEKLHGFEVGDEVEVFLNEAWIKTQVGLKHGEQALMNITYGDGVGCEARIPSS